MILKSLVSLINETRMNVDNFNQYFEDYKRTLNDNFAGMMTKIQDDIQQEVMSKVGKDLYDYSDIVPEDLQHFPGQFRCNNVLKFVQTHYLDKFVTGEMIIFLLRWSENNSMHVCVVSNYGRHFKHQYDYNGANYQDMVKYVDNIITPLNFWIPKDYIYIIRNTLLFVSSHVHHTWSLEFNLAPGYNSFRSSGLLDLLKHIKENLENGNYVKNNVDIKYMDVYQEKIVLDNDTKEFEIYKTKQLRELEEQQKKIEEKQKQLEEETKKNLLLARKIKLERLKLDKDKQDFEQKMLESLSIDEFLQKDLNNIDDLD